MGQRASVGERYFSSPGSRRHKAGALASRGRWRITIAVRMRGMETAHSAAFMPVPPFSHSTGGQSLHG